MTTFPVRIKMPSKAIEEASYSECGSWEDCGCSPDGEVYVDSDGEQSRAPHAYQILMRHKTFIELRDEYEVEEVYWALMSGTWADSDCYGYHPSGQTVEKFQDACEAILKEHGAVDLPPRGFLWPRMKLPGSVAA